jgi:hydroxypyruvate isomerase
MIRLSACIEPFFDGLPYLEKIKTVAKLGFKYYELWFHNLKFEGGGLHEELKDFDAVAEINGTYGIELNDFVFNHPDGGIRADLINKDHKQKLLDGLGEIIPLAKKVNCKKLISGSGNVIPGRKRQDGVDAMIGNLKALAPMVEKEDVTLILEPFNSRVDHPDYFLDDPYTAMEVLKAVGSSNIKMLFDIYHMQIMSGNILGFLKENIDFIGHFHVAGVPGRNEPMNCELNYSFILNEIDAMGYDGCFGLEYWPRIEDEKSLKKTKKYLGG